MESGRVGPISLSLVLLYFVLYSALLLVDTNFLSGPSSQRPTYPPAQAPPTHAERAKARPGQIMNGAESVEVDQDLGRDEVKYV